MQGALVGDITEIIPGEGFTLYVPFTHTEELSRRPLTQADVFVTDRRQLSPAQRRKVFALVGDITDYASGVAADSKQSRAERQRTLCALEVGYIVEYSTDAVRRVLTERYAAACGIDWFSLADRTPLTCDMSTARDFIDWLVTLCVENDVPCVDTLLNRCEDIGRYLYVCVVNRKCAVCGQTADIHEVDAVGMGRDRRTISHIGQRVQPLCRIHHNEAHSAGQRTFDARYHLESIVLTEEMCDRLGWKA